MADAPGQMSAVSQGLRARESGAHAASIARPSLSPTLRRDYILRRALVVSDLVALGLSLFATVLLQRAFGRPVDVSTTIIAAALVPIWLPIGISARLYPLAGRGEMAGFADEIGPVFRAATIWSWLVLIVRVVFESGYVLLLPSLGLWAFSILGVLALRTLVRAFARTRPWYLQRALVVGEGDDAKRVISRVVRHPEWGLEVVGTASLFRGGLAVGGEASEEPHANGHRNGTGNGTAAGALGRPDSGLDAHDPAIGADMLLGQGPEETARAQASLLVDWAEKAGVARVIFASHPGPLGHRTTLARALTAAGVQVDLVPGDSDILRSNGEVHHFEGLPVISLLPASLPRSFGLVKRVFDLALAIPLLGLASPLLLYCAIRIKLDSPGPVFFRQERVGLHRERFQLLKLRSMSADADRQIEEVAALSLHGNGTDSGMFKVPRDPRITQFGAWLRKWSIDELPQLLNVIKGEMSLVGPRPLPTNEDLRVGEDFEARYKVRPGITGRWQVLGRSDIPFEDMVRLDYTYVIDWSLTEDMKLLLRTISVVMLKRGAY